VTPVEIQSLVFGLVQALVTSSAFLVTVFVGFCVLAGFTKHRVIGKSSLVVRSLEDRVGSGARFLAPAAPRGPADQLKTPELLEHAGRQAP
jgi:hypothetical protein